MAVRRGLSGGYGPPRSGERREHAAVPGAFGGRRDAPKPRPDIRGRGPKGYTRSDDRIRDLVCDALTDAPDLDAGGIEVVVDKGEVTLDGTVSDRAGKHYAEGIIAEVGGVRHVQNNLRALSKT